MDIAGGDIANLGIGNFPLEQWFFEMPPCTRYWTTATVITSILLQCKVISPLQLFYTFRAVYYKSQVSSHTQFSTSTSLTRSPVLAPPHDLHLLWATLPRPCFPPFLHVPLQPPPRIDLRTEPRNVLLVAALQHRFTPRPLFIHELGTVPRAQSQPNTRLHLVTAKSRHKTCLFGTIGIQRALPALGTHGIQPIHARQHTERRNIGGNSGACVLLLRRCMAGHIPWKSPHGSAGVVGEIMGEEAARSSGDGSEGCARRSAGHRAENGRRALMKRKTSIVDIPYD